MDQDPISKPPCRRADAEVVLRQLREAGHVAYFAGGCVRDLLMGLQPKDYDIATDAPPKRVRQLFSNTQAVGQMFGVILVRHEGSVVEVATFRSDGKYLDGRRPEQVRFTTAEEDAQRRDFTINGLFMDPLAGDRIIDYVGGRDDLRLRILRAIGDPGQRFSEDHLRLLRAVRFAARFGFAIEQQTSHAMLRHAPLLKGISPERICDELRRMLTVTSRDSAWNLLWSHQLMPVVLRFLAPTHATMLPPAAASDLFLALTPGAPLPFGVALAGMMLAAQLPPAPGDARPLLARSAVQKSARALDQALKLSNDEFDLMTGSLEGLALLLADPEPGVAQLKRFLARPTSDASRLLLEALRRIGLHTQRIDWLVPQLEDLSRGEFAPLPLITGDDLLASGLLPGPAFKRILDAVYDAQLEQRVRTKERAMEMAIDLSRSGG